MPRLDKINACMVWSRSRSWALALCLCLMLPVVGWCQTEDYYADDTTLSEDDYYYEDDFGIEEEEDPFADVEQIGFLQPDQSRNPKRTMPTEGWNQAREGLDYSGNPPAQREKPDGPDLSWLAPFLKPVIIAVFIFLIVFILVLIWRNARLNRKVEQPSKVTAQTISQLEENLLESDLERTLRLALEQENYRAAVRIYYLMVIKALWTGNFIQWKKDKTNGAYLRELRGNAVHGAFRNATRAFEAIWYGDHDINATNFAQLVPLFDQLLADLKTHRR